MADPLIALGLNAVPPIVNNYDKAWEPVKNNVKKIRKTRSKHHKDHDYEDMTPEQRGWVLKPRKDVASDEEIVEYVGKRNETKGKELVRHRPGGSMVRRASSVDRGVNEYHWAKGGAAKLADDSSDDEVDSRRRRGRSRASYRSRGNTTELRSKSTSSSSSSIISSSEDERNCRKMRRKKWITAGLATVATIHAAQKVYTSLEARDKRSVEVAKGEITPEEARKKMHSARWQDAAAVGIAALGIKGAYSEWHEMAEQREEYEKEQKEREERHRRRVARAQRAKELGIDYRDLLHPHQSGHYKRSKSERRSQRSYDGDDDGGSGDYYTRRGDEYYPSPRDGYQRR